MDSLFPTPTPAAYKQAARRFASGVTVVTTSDGATLFGGTVTGFMTLCLEPLQVLISLGTPTRLAKHVMHNGVFAVSILASNQECVSQAFATAGRPAAVDAFPGIESFTAATGAPIIAGCLGYFDCTVADMFRQGDHTLFVGDVQAVDAADGPPLLYFDGGYRRLALESFPLA